MTSRHDHRPSRGPGGTRARTPDAGRVVLAGTLKIGARDGKPLDHIYPGPPTTRHRTGRRQDRARLTIPEAISELTGLVPHAHAEYCVTDDGWTHLRPLPGQDPLRLEWQVHRLLAMEEARRQQDRTVRMELDKRVPYADIGRSPRKQRRRIERRRGIPRTYPHGS